MKTLIDEGTQHKLLTIAAALRTKPHLGAEIDRLADIATAPLTVGEIVSGVVRSFLVVGSDEQRAEAKQILELLDTLRQSRKTFDAGQGAGFAPDGSPVDAQGNILEE
jgi:predicted nucleic acid-binding protein